MAAHLERQGERVALLAVMDTIPRNSMESAQDSIDDQQDEPQRRAAVIQSFTNHVEDALPGTARPYIEEDG
jgi:thioesterase domain-containing protein